MEQDYFKISTPKKVKNEKQEYYIKGYNEGYNNGWWAGMGGFLITLCLIKFIIML